MQVRRCMRRDANSCQPYISERSCADHHPERGNYGVETMGVEPLSPCPPHLCSHDRKAPATLEGTDPGGHEQRTSTAQSAPECGSIVVIVPEFEQNLLSGVLPNYTSSIPSAGNLFAGNIKESS